MDLYDSIDFALRKLNLPLEEDTVRKVTDLVEEKFKSTNTQSTPLSTETLWDDLVDWHCSPYLMTGEQRRAIERIEITRKDIEIVLRY